MWRWSLFWDRATADAGQGLAGYILKKRKQGKQVVLLSVHLCEQCHEQIRLHNNIPG